MSHRARDRIKVLYWTTRWLGDLVQTIERGRFQLPTDVQPADETRAGVEISASDMSLLLGGIDLASVKRRRRYQRPHKPR
ncbi:MAG: IS66 family insertion sequence element accessory protein TnpB [Pirellulaceae bacterium]